MPDLPLQICRKRKGFFPSPLFHRNIPIIPHSSQKIKFFIAPQNHTLFIFDFIVKNC